MTAVNLSSLSAIALDAKQWQGLADRGILGALVQTMKDYVAEPEVQEIACKALKCFATHGELLEEISDRGGVEVVLGALTKHLDSPGVQEQGFGVLWNLGFDVQAKTNIFQAGGIDIVLRGIDKHNAVAGVLVNGFGTLRKFCCEEPEIQDALIQLGGLDVCTRAMEKHMMSQPVGTEFCGFVWTLTRYHFHLVLHSGAGSTVLQITAKPFYKMPSSSHVCRPVVP